MSAVVETRDLAVDLAGIPVLRGIDLSITAGEFVAVLGSNGSGKSTLVRTLVGLVPYRGTINVFGEPLDKFSARQRLGYLAQRPATGAGVPATVTEVVTSGALSAKPHLGWPSRRDRAATHQLIDRVGLTSHAHRPITELSGGQAQRAYIARALVGNPDLLVMDEPTAGVDAHSASVFADLLDELSRQGTTIILVTHELGPFADLIGRAVHLEQGLVEYDGPALGPGTHDHHHDHAHTSRPDTLRPVPIEGPLPQGGTR